MGECLCDGCQKVFETEEEVLEHEKTCKKTLWLCSGCQKIFETEEEALEHEKTCQKAIDFEKVWEEGETKEKKRKLLEETVSIDEAVSYGFEMFKGIFKYVIVLLILGVNTFLIMFASIKSGEPAIGLLAIPVYVIILILNFSLIVGIFYKFWVDILARSRK